MLCVRGVWIGWSFCMRHALFHCVETCSIGETTRKSDVFFLLSAVFASLLGDTILVDDLDSANHYRRGVRESTRVCVRVFSRAACTCSRFRERSAGGPEQDSVSDHPDASRGEDTQQREVWGSAEQSSIHWEAQRSSVWSSATQRVRQHPRSDR